MGSFYPECQELRVQASKLGVPVTVLPQSFIDSEEDIDLYDRIWVREKASLKVCPSAGLAPDLAMSARLQARTETIVKKSGIFLREDIEALFPDHSSSFGDPAILANNIASYLDLIAPFEHIVTDRLHFAIAAMLMQRKTTLLPNTYYKNRSMWETWLHDLGCEWADHPEQLQTCRRRKVHRRIPVADDLNFTGKDVIKPVTGWLENEHESKVFLQNVQQSIHLALDRKQQQLWRTLDNGIAFDSLEQLFQTRIGGTVRHRRYELNQMLRSWFNLGAIQINPDQQTRSSPKHRFSHTINERPLEITVYKPFELNNEVFVFADILVAGKLKAAWFRIDTKYRDCLSHSTDPFVLAFLQLAMRNGCPLWLRNGGVSAGLLRNLQQFQRVWSLWHKHYSEVDIIGAVFPLSSDEEYNTGDTRNVITSFSGGVDSTFTLFNHTQNTHNRYQHKLSHAMLVHGFDIPLSDQSSFDSVQQQCSLVARDVGIELLVVATNIREFDFDWEQGHVSAIASCMHLLSNGFATGLVPSTLNYGVLYPWGSTPLTDPMHSSNALRIETDGADYTRVDKVRLLKDWKTGIENLRFCWVAEPYDHNCGRCAKCTITAIMLLLTRASKKSIQPFPGSKRLEQQLDSFPLTRLDRSDFRNDNDTLEQIKHKPRWLVKFLSKLNK